MLNPKKKSNDLRHASPDDPVDPAEAVFRTSTLDLRNRKPGISTVRPIPAPYTLDFNDRHDGLDAASDSEYFSTEENLDSNTPSAAQIGPDAAIQRAGSKIDQGPGVVAFRSLTLRDNSGVGSNRPGAGHGAPIQGQGFRADRGRDAFDLRTHRHPQAVISLTTQADRDMQPTPSPRDKGVRAGTRPPRDVIDEEIEAFWDSFTAEELAALEEQATLQVATHSIATSATAVDGLASTRNDSGPTPNAFQMDEIGKALNEVSQEPLPAAKKTANRESANGGSTNRARKRAPRRVFDEEREEFLDPPTPEGMNGLKKQTPLQATGRSIGPSFARAGGQTPARNSSRPLPDALKMDNLGGVPNEISKEPASVRETPNKLDAPRDLATKLVRRPEQSEQWSPATGTYGSRKSRFHHVDPATSHKVLQSVSSPPRTRQDNKSLDPFNLADLNSTLPTHTPRASLAHVPGSSEASVGVKPVTGVEPTLLVIRDGTTNRQPVSNSNSDLDALNASELKRFVEDKCLAPSPEVTWENVWLVHDARIALKSFGDSKIESKAILRAMEISDKQGRPELYRILTKIPRKNVSAATLEEAFRTDLKRSGADKREDQALTAALTALKEGYQSKHSSENQRFGSISNVSTDDLSIWGLRNAIYQECAAASSDPLLEKVRDVLKAYNGLAALASVGVNLDEKAKLKAILSAAKITWSSEADLTNYFHTSEPGERRKSVSRSNAFKSISQAIDDRVQDPVRRADQKKAVIKSWSILQERKHVRGNVRSQLREATRGHSVSEFDNTQTSFINPHLQRSRPDIFSGDSLPPSYSVTPMKGTYGSRQTERARLTGAGYRVNGNWATGDGRDAYGQNKRGRHFVSRTDSAHLVSHSDSCGSHLPRKDGAEGERAANMGVAYNEYTPVHQMHATSYWNKNSQNFNVDEQKFVAYDPKHHAFGTPQAAREAYSTALRDIVSAETGSNLSITMQLYNLEASFIQRHKIDSGKDLGYYGDIKDLDAADNSFTNTINANPPVYYIRDKDFINSQVSSVKDRRVAFQRLLPNEQAEVRLSRQVFSDLTRNGQNKVSFREIITDEVTSNVAKAYLPPPQYNEKRELWEAMATVRYEVLNEPPPPYEQRLTPENNEVRRGNTYDDRERSVRDR